MNLEEELRQVISRKAVGPRGSRHLNEKDLNIIIPALKDGSISLVSKAVLIASVVVQDRNELEEHLLNEWKSDNKGLPEALNTLFFDDSRSTFTPELRKILGGEDLNRSESHSAITYLLDDDIPDYKKSVFLITERLKRESAVENHAFLQALRNAVPVGSVDVPLLVDFADPYDGYVRYPIYTPFVASLLAAMGVSVIAHGVHQVAPKNGITTHKILKLAGKNSLKSRTSVIEELENDDVGWGYLDQSVYFPALDQLNDLRQDMVKRSFLATLEKLLQPLRSPHRNYMIAGYVHSHYKQELTELLKDKSMLDRAFIVKGLEGSTQLDFRKKSENKIIKNNTGSLCKIEGNDISLKDKEWEQHNSMAEYVLETAIDALNGEKNRARDILINQVRHIMGHLGIMKPDEAVSEAQKILDSGRALHHWKNGAT